MLDNLKDRQIAVYEKEKQLHSETQNLLFDVLNEVLVSGKKDKLNGFYVNDLQFIVTVKDAETLIVEDTGEIEAFETNLSIDSIPQHEQKLLIDWIMYNVFNK